MSSFRIHSPAAALRQQFITTLAQIKRRQMAATRARQMAAPPAPPPLRPRPHSPS